MGIGEVYVGRSDVGIRAIYRRERREKIWTAVREEERETGKEGRNRERADSQERNEGELF